MIRHYNDLTIKQFLRLKAITEIEEDTLQRKLLMLAEISGKSVEELEQMPIGELMDSLKDFAKIESLQPDTRMKLKFKVKGQRFECIWKTQDILASQYIDATSFTQTNIVDNIHNILASICVRRTWFGRRLPYDGSRHKEIAELFYQHMKISQAYPIMLFFCKYLQELENNTGAYLMAEIQKTQEMFLSRKSGVG